MLYWSKHEQRAEPRVRERVARAREAVLVQPPEIHALLEIDLHAARRLQRALPAVAGIGRIVEAVRTALRRAPGIDAVPRDDAAFGVLLARHGLVDLRAGGDQHLREPLHLRADERVELFRAWSAWASRPG